MRATMRRRVIHENKRRLAAGVCDSEPSRQLVR